MTPAAALALALALVAQPGEPAADARRLAADLDRLSRRRVLFGHQSVGADLVTALRRLAAAHVGAFRVVDLAPGAAVPAGAFAHARVERNGDPRAKLRAFERLLAADGGPPPDVALVKLCWADVGAETDVAVLFETYRATLRDLARRYPATTFVHVTVPLTTVQTGPVAFAKRLLGRPPHGVLANARREELNALMRRELGGEEPLFDLARLEATAPDGAVSSARWNGVTSLALSAANASDGGHLHAQAADRVARALVATLAALP